MDREDDACKTVVTSRNEMVNPLCFAHGDECFELRKLTELLVCDVATYAFELHVGQRVSPSFTPPAKVFHRQFPVVPYGISPFFPLSCAKALECIVRGIDSSRNECIARRDHVRQPSEAACVVLFAA